MKYIKRFIMLWVLADNFLTNFFKRFFGSKWKIVGWCRQCGQCCQKILLKMTPAQMQSPFFTNLAIRWISWLFDFKLLGIDRERGYLAFTCKHLQSNGKCGNYFWRPNICRNYPLTDYFEKPVFLPGCGFYAKPR